MIILFCGPESSGKSTFSKYLEKQTHFYLIREYARDYLNTKPNNFKYEFVDLCAIYSEHEKNYQDKVRSENHIILDSDLMNMMFWTEEKFGERIPGLRKRLQRRKYDLIFLCKPDFPWEADPLRENENDRLRLFFRYQKKLEDLSQDFIVLEGTQTQKEVLIMEQINSQKTTL